MPLSAAPNRRVIKLGGSLLARADWPEMFVNWLRTQSPAENLLLIGGGELVDALRRIDSQRHLPSDLTHRLAIQLMDVNSVWAAEVLRRAGSNVAVATEWPPDKSNNDSDLTLIQLAPLLNQLECLSREAGIPVPEESWNVTSDSLAAWLAALWPADELVLLKSCAPPHDSANIQDWVASGYVDAYFANWRNCVRTIRAVDLSREREFAAHDTI